MSENNELKDCPWGDSFVVDTSFILTGEVATENPRDFVSLISRRSCGANGRLIFVVNRHDEQRIFVTVRTRWVYQGQPHSQTRTYALEPGGEAEVGCTIPGPTGQRFDRDITGARFG